MSHQRRKLIKGLGLGTAWSTPVIQAVVLPAHAQTSVTTTTAPVPCVPDLTPSLTVNPNSNITGAVPMTITITISEINGCDTDGSDITTTISIPDDFTQNNISLPSGWSAISTSGNLWIFRTSQVMSAGSSAMITITGTWDAGASAGSTNFTSTILNGSGGETVTTNNVDTETVTYTST